MSISGMKCKLYRKIEDTITKVVESYTFGEIMTDAKDCLVKECIKAVKQDLTDEIFPVRLLNKCKKERLVAVIAGEESIRADAEILSLSINSLIAAGIKEFKITLSHKGKDDDKVEELFEILESYGLSDFIDVDFDYEGTALSNSFVFECKYDDKVILRGGKGFDGFAFSYVSFMPVELTEIIFNSKIKELSDLPVAVVASTSPADSYKIAFGLRAQGLNVREYLKTTSMVDAIEYTEALGSTIIIWVARDKIVMKNIKTGEMSETTAEKLLGGK